MNIKKNDTVIVLSGKDKGVKGKGIKYTTEVIRRKVGKTGGKK